MSLTTCSRGNRAVHDGDSRTQRRTHRLFRRLLSANVHTILHNHERHPTHTTATALHDSKCDPAKYGGYRTRSLRYGEHRTRRYTTNRYLVGEVENGAVARAADVTVALCAEGGAANVAAEGPPADGTRHEVPRPHSVRPSRQSRQSTHGGQMGTTNGHHARSRATTRLRWQPMVVHARGQQAGSR